MPISHTSRRAVGLCAAFLLAGCGGSQTGPPPAATLNSAARAASSAGDLLYIAHDVREHGVYRGVVTVLTFPSGTAFATIPLDGFADGACSDASGNVWIVVGQQNHKYEAYEFAHGASKPIAKIAITHAHGIAGECAIDPETGDLAVVVGAVNCGSCHAGVDIWRGARKGKPETIAIPFTPVGCTYDDSGNLFVDGYVGSTVFFAFGELARGSESFRAVRLDKMPGGYPGGVGWDGSYVVILAENVRRGPELYRVDVSQYMGHVSGVVHLKGLYYGGVFDVYGGSVVGSRGNSGRMISLWPYPGGGKQTETLDHVAFAPRGLAISTASVH